MKKIYVLLILAICTASCSVSHLQPYTDTFSGEVKVDTTYVLDSVFIDRIRTIKEKADTIYVTDIKTEYKYRYRDRIKIDTLIQEKIVTEIKEIEKRLTWWQSFRLKTFWYLFGVIILWIIWKIVKLRLHL